MAKGNNQKGKLLYLARIFMTETDEAHGLTAAEIAERLNAMDISAERKTLYQDFEELRLFGMDIISESAGRSTVYKLVSRDFELAELKLLVDSVQASRFITEKKSAQLISKLEGLVSRYEASQLRRQVLISGRVKSMNESIYYNVDKIHGAIADNREIEFQYFQWNTAKEQVLRHEGKRYRISPWALIWDDENYYLLGYDDEEGKLKHYRVDKMLKLTRGAEGRKGEEAYKKKDLAAYTTKIFGMFGGAPLRVTVEAINSLAGVFIDRFGTEIPIVRVDEEHFQAMIDVELSNQFLGWIVGLGSGVRIVGPEAAVEAMKARVAELAACYAAD